MWSKPVPLRATERLVSARKMQATCDRCIKKYKPKRGVRWDHRN